MNPSSNKPLGFLTHPKRALNRTAVYIEVRPPTAACPNAEAALRHLQSLGSITLTLVSAPRNSVKLMACETPLIIVGRSPHRLGKEQEEIDEILDVLAAHGLDARV